MVEVQPDLRRSQHHDYYRTYLQRYCTQHPQLATLEEAKSFELLEDCVGLPGCGPYRQLKYQCSIMMTV